MSGGPKDASISGDGFRWYQWDPKDGSEPVNVLSVTSIRSLCGQPFQLVNWQLGNIINAAMGTTKRPAIGARGGILKGKYAYVPDGEQPGEFVRLMIAANGSQAALDKTRAWLSAKAEKPRDTAATRGTIVHEAIELGVKPSQVDLAYVEAAAQRLSKRDRDKVAKHGGITEEDVQFIEDCMRQYWDMREEVPFVIIAQEPQVWNLTAGYAGSADALVWFLGDWVEGLFVPLKGMTPDRIKAIQKQADAGLVTQSHIAEIGGTVVLGDWKTSADIHTDNVVQVHAYLGTEFVGRDGVKDVRLSEIIRAAAQAAIIHIRPDGWAVYFADFDASVMYAFLGSVAFARFLAAHKYPGELFTHTVRGSAS